MTVYFYPFDPSENSYLQNMIKIIGKYCLVKKLPSPKRFFELLSFRDEKDVLFIHWLEDHISKKNLFYIFLWLTYILFLKLIFKKIIWVRHNFCPHEHENLIRYKLVCAFMGGVCSKKIAHRELLGYEYLPHPLYRSTEACDSFESYRDIDYLYFGSIKRYKGLVELLETWPPEKLLHIRGKCDNEELLKEIEVTIFNRGLNVNFENCFLSIDDLNNLLARTRFVIIPHIDNRMIVSGSFFHAASFGANIIMRDGGFYEYLISKFSFVNKISDFNENYINPSLVFKELKLECSESVILAKLAKIGVYFDKH